MNELTTLSPRFSTMTPEAKILSLLIFETGTYEQQWRRTYTTQVDHTVVNQFREQLEGQTHYSAAQMTGIAQSFIKPTTAVQGAINIAGPGSWNERRCRFMMVVEYDAGLHVKMQEILTGYTTHVGAIRGAHAINAQADTTYLTMDHDLQFFVNSTIKVRRITERGPMGVTESLAIASNTHVLADNSVNGGMYNPVHEERMRPTDLFAAMSRSHLHEAQSHNPGLGSTIYDTRTAQSKMAALSLRANVIPSNYVARVLDNYKNAAVVTNDPTQGNGNDFYGNARAYSNDGLVTQDAVLKMVGDIRQEPAGNTFRFSDLLRMDPTIERRVMGRVSGATQRIQGLHETGATTKWDGQDSHTLSASIISQCVPGIMADLGLSRLVFKTHNQFIISGNYSRFDQSTHLGAPGNLPEFVEQFACGFADQNLAPAMAAFERRFWFEVMKDLSMDNQIPFALEVNADLAGETIINISLDNNPMEQFATPSFADALLTPLVTNNQQHVQKVAKDFNDLIEAVLQVDESSPTVTGPLFNQQF